MSKQNWTQLFLFNPNKTDLEEAAALCGIPTQDGVCPLEFLLLQISRQINCAQSCCV